MILALLQPRQTISPTCIPHGVTTQPLFIAHGKNIFTPLKSATFQLSTAQSPIPGTSQTKAERLVRAYQELGHKEAKINLLDLLSKRDLPPDELRPEFYGLTEADLDTEITLGPEVLPQFASDNVFAMALREIITAFEKMYCGSIGAESLHVATREEREWIQERLETPFPYQFDSEENKRIFDRLMWTTTFERFMLAKLLNAKRFSTEGVESHVPALKAIIDASAENGVREFIFPCCHRRKLNVLSNVARKPNELIFSEFSADSKSDGRFFPTAHQLDRQHQDANMQVVYMTTPANLFHVLRSQVHRDFRKHTAITRVEQLHPFPWEQVRDNLNQYPNASDIVWCQEESLNDGPWSFAKTEMKTIFDTVDQHKGRRLRFAGREATPSFATGFAKEHRAQEEALLKEALHYL
ncbi:2-oxoglutarate dehydrogenase E1 component [Penicillium ochrochloron]